VNGSVSPPPDTRRQVEIIRAYVGAGSIKLAAHRLGISESTARQHLAGLYRRVGCQNAVQAAYMRGASEGRAA
jgi:DNA-binding NarL/FixJ family response regulator